jgi:hypothetical protein
MHGFHDLLFHLNKFLVYKSFIEKCLVDCDWLTFFLPEFFDFLHDHSLMYSQNFGVYIYIYILII